MNNSSLVVPCTQYIVVAQALGSLLYIPALRILDVMNVWAGQQTPSAVTGISFDNCPHHWISLSYAFLQDPVRLHIIVFHSIPSFLSIILTCTGRTLFWLQSGSCNPMDLFCVYSGRFPDVHAKCWEKPDMNIACWVMSGEAEFWCLCCFGAAALVRKGLHS